MRLKHRVFTIAILFSALFSSLNSIAGIVRTHETGFYQITLEELKQLQVSSAKLKLGQLKIHGSEQEQPYFFKSQKKKLGNEDSIIFFAKQLEGKHFKQHLHDDFNGFSVNRGKKRLRTNSWFAKKPKASRWSQCEILRTHQHYEKNELLIRVNTQQYKQAPELWYWKKINQLNKKGFSVELHDQSYANHEDVEIKAVFRSTNIDRQARNTNDHELHLLFNGEKIESFQWDGKAQFITENIKLPKKLFKPEKNTITFKVPKRKVELNGKKQEIIDIVMLDYFVISHNIEPEAIDSSMVLYAEQPCLMSLDDNQFGFNSATEQYLFDSIKLDSDSKVYLGKTDTLKSVKVEELQNLSFDKSAVDYLMIAHPKFIETIEDLANHHRSQGKTVEVVDVNHIYKNYSHGVRELYAIKNFIQDTHKSGNGRLKHVLLVGDSSWDWRQKDKKSKYGIWANREFRGNNNFTGFPHQHYQSNITNRDFVPTGQYHSYEGHSASDNWFVSIIPEKNTKNKTHEEDYIPDLAVGRFPASTVEELQSMVNKTINYEAKTKVGPWKSRILWITNSNKRFQKSSLRHSDLVGNYGVMADKVFPPEMDGDNIKIQQDLSKAFDDGELIVHFLGHGGKSIWRIGPPDLKKNRDLFTMKQVSNLKNSGKLPFVMSMSCYSAPFDHPLADSIGEKFIREPEVGAVAVLAASWRNAPNSRFSSMILEEIYKNPEQSVGQAILKAKREFKGRTMIEMYNLLGDPALKLAIPELPIKTQLEDQFANLKIDSPNFDGKAIVEFLDSESNSIKKYEVDVTNSEFKIAMNDSVKNCKQARIYAWDSNQNIDAMGSFSCSPE